MLTQTLVFVRASESVFFYFLVEVFAPGYIRVYVLVQSTSSRLCAVTKGGHGDMVMAPLGWGGGGGAK